MGKNRNIIGLLNSFTSTLKQYSKSVFLFLNGKKDGIRTTTLTASQVIPEVIRKPSVIRRWLLTAYWFFISLFITLILMNTVIPVAVDKTLSKIYPQIETKKIFGLFVEKSDDPRIAWQRTVILAVFWAGTCGVNAYVLLLCLPGAVRRADIEARKREASADALVNDKPSESILLYSKALKLAVNPAYESTLKSKIDSLDSAIKTGQIDQHSSIAATAAELQGTGTVVLSPNESRDRLKPANLIGPEGRYRIEKELGHGSMGLVFLATDQLLFRNVALKKLTAGFGHNQDIVTRFQQEARALAQLSHTNIVQVYDFVQEGHEYWIAMEFVEGTDLESIIDESGKYDLDDSLRICIRIAGAMDYAHSRGVVHRDFKPSNVLITVDGEPKVMDFGLAKLSLSSIATMEGSLLGSPAFMSPEQARGEAVDARSDIYALGVSMCQLMTGELPFEGDVKSVLAQKIAGQAPSLALLKKLVPGKLADLIREMMAVNPDDRPATMKDVSQTLESLNH